MNFMSVLTADASAQAGGGALSLLITIGPLILMFVIMYFILIRPQKKKDKETQKMRQNVQVGDEITTIGGIIGLVVSLKEDNVDVYKRQR